jgi:GNAT superfamily N-acetyltransferase
VIERYRPEDFRAVRAFAGKLDNFFYVRLIIREHLERRRPGACYVWREDGRIVAFSAIAYLNPDDAWLWGMRVDPAYHGRGVATRFTREQFRIVRQSGRSWAGLNTLDSRKPKATFRVMEKLGFRLEETQCDDVFWRRPRRLLPPRLGRFPGIINHFRRLGRRTVFFCRDGWLNFRLAPARAAWLDRFGRTLDGVPLAVIPYPSTDLKGRRYPVIAVNLFDRPVDFGAFVPRLLALSPKKGNIVLNYPAEWKRDVHRAARAAIPGLGQDHGMWASTWRIYGKRLRP